MRRPPGIAAVWLACSLAANAVEPWTLERALDYALAHNPDARLAQQKIVAARAGWERANSAFWPRLQFNSSYTRTDNPMLVFGSILNQRAYNSSLNFNDVPAVDDMNVRGIVTMPLYAGGKNAAGREAAKAATAAAKHGGEAARNALGFEVVRSFETVLKTREFIRVAEAEVGSYQTNLTIAGNRLGNGTLLRSEVLNVEVRLGRAREDLAQARIAGTLAERSLRALLGLDLEEFAVADVAPAPVEPEAGDFSRRPELAAATEAEHAAEARVREAKSGYQPRVSAFGMVDHDYGWVTRGEGDSYSAGVVLQWDLWDGNSTRSGTREAIANLESAREERRKVRLALGLEVEQARLGLDAAKEGLTVTDKSVEQAAETAALLRRRFEQGLALSTELIEAETALVAARARRAEAESDRRIAIAALRKALALPQLDSPTARP